MTLVRVEPRYDGQALRIILDRPPGNILDTELIGELRAALHGAGLDSTLKLVAIEGAGAHFSYGASVEEHLPAQIGHALSALHDLIRDVLDVPAPTAAVVRGRCLGGGFELALACDFILAADDARLGVPEIALGVFPPAAAALLPIKVGGARAAAAVLTGEALDARTWADAGLIARVAPAAELDAAGEQWFAAYLAPRSAAALRHATWVMRAPARLAAQTTVNEFEHRYLDQLMRTQDAEEGIRAFLEKRPARWSHA
jgi:cyclohexa-1,5-dienecarbonyl-CoA hydratase